MAQQQNPTPDANSRLKARLRPSVPPRKTSLIRSSADSGGVEEQHTEQSEEASMRPKTVVATEKPSKLVSFTLRVDEAVGKGLKSLCSEENITKETFLEAVYQVCSEDEQIMQQVLEIAKARRQQRKEAGIIRRAKAMSKYLPEKPEG